MWTTARRRTGPWRPPSRSRRRSTESSAAARTRRDRFPVVHGLDRIDNGAGCGVPRDTAPGTVVPASRRAQPVLRLRKNTKSYDLIIRQLLDRRGGPHRLRRLQRHRRAAVLLGA
ncbi:hypothetical protein GCM10011374_04800 [Kocuria dechangensis]|uniref:Uncharacterized protein n=1 Tax=Kocuria dechangensis TaxID=1176249 RepID=A0A917GHK9_9MICC|nr:hypothetical protein GCM10011374_04800 [Kocuria dechangensis]